jgi:flagellar protein FliO/FliZ
MLELTIRLIVSLAIVVGLLLLLARFGARRFRGQAGALVRVVHRQPLSRTSAVAVVTVGSRVLVLGTTEHQVSILTELEPEELDLVVEVPDEVVEQRASASDQPRPEQPRPLEVSELVDAIEPRDPLAGSVLSAQTWRQAFQVATQAASRASARRAS